MGLGGLIRKVFTPIKLKKRVYDPEKVSIEDIKLPRIIDYFNSQVIITMVKEEVVTYKSLKYKDKTIDELTKITYHSFQIGVLMKYLQFNYDLFIPNKEKVFPSFVLNMPFETLQVKIFDIIALYDDVIPKDPTGKELIEDIRWTPLDTTYLLYYLTIYKDRNTEDKLV